MKRYPNTTVLLSYMLVILCSCFSLMLVSFKHKSQRLFKVPVIMNKGKDAPICLAPNFMMKAEHTVERVEKFGDTLNLAVKPKGGFEICDVESSKDANTYFKDGGLRIIVDTQTEVGVSIRNGMPMVQASPVYIINESTHSAVEIETRNGKLKMIVEALSTKNTWEPIECLPENINSKKGCMLNLPAHCYAFTKNILHCGDHITKCRLKLMSGNNSYYSNTFMMGINYTQFEIF
ncbi:MAG: hypothetical protein SGJ15_14625 [Bacteroidota bacterium]|nr:hypothetical protein [Bacteroidota bacterium]